MFEYFIGRANGYRQDNTSKKNRQNMYMTAYEHNPP